MEKTDQKQVEYMMKTMQKIVKTLQKIDGPWFDIRLKPEEMNYWALKSFVDRLKGNGL